MTVAGDQDLALAALAGQHPVAFFGTLTELIELAGAAAIVHDDLHVHGTVIPAATDRGDDIG
jgi:hypothetical protein